MNTNSAAVRWIGLRDSVEGLLSPEGLGHPRRLSDADLLASAQHLRRGTLRAEFRVDPSPEPRNIVKFSRRDPAPVSFVIRTDPDGTLALMIRNGSEDRLVTLPIAPCPAGSRLNLQYGWDLEADLGYFWAEIPSIGASALVPVPRSIGFGLSDLHHMMSNRAAMTLPKDILLFAVADGLAPAGPLPDLDGSGLVATAEGAHRRLDELKTGDIVIAADGEPAQVRWLGSGAHLALGHMTPFLIQPPYFGAAKELCLSGSAHVRADGAEVDYLFGKADVTVRLRHLSDGVSVEPLSQRRPQDLRPSPTRLYHQLVLDRPVPIRLSGVACETIDLSDILHDPNLMARSVFAGYPKEVLSHLARDERNVLQEFEARTLRQMQVA